MITLRFVTLSDFASAAIRIYQYGFWASHVEALIDGKLVGSHLKGGVRARPIGYDAKTLVREQMISIDADDAATKTYESFVQAQIGKPYDVKAIVAMLVQRDWRDPNKWFCSELIAAAFEECKVFSRLPSAVNHILPRDIALMVSALP